jgi:hypothetical protein
MKIWMIIFLTALPFPSFAQMALPSVFPEMRTINPAVVSLRKSGNMRLSALSDNIKKNQPITILNGVPFNASEDSKISFLDGNFFYGGKGGGLTTELSADYTTGKRATTLTDNVGGTSTFNTNAASNYVSLAMGAGALGLGLHYIGFKSDYAFSQTVNETPFNSNVTQKLTIIGVKPGIIIGGPSLSLGITAEFDKLKSTITSNPPMPTSGGTPDSFKYVGIALATGGANSVFEIGVEADPITDPGTNPSTNEKLPMPMKISFLAETKLASLTLGYKGMAFKGQYMDLDKIIPTQLVYSEPSTDFRLEHIFNFSFGGSTGWSFGGSASYSNATKKEKSSFFGSRELYDTKITEYSAAAKMSYVF